MRRAVALSLVVMFGTLAPPASAGTYEVPACDAAGGVNNSWAAVNNSPFTVTAYAECPSGGDADRGLVARNLVTANASASTGQVAQMMFRAPGGTAIVALRISAMFYRTDNRWEAALSNGAVVLRGCGAGGANSCSWETPDSGWINIPGSAAVYIDAFCAIGPCPLASTTSAHHYRTAESHLYSATVRIQDDTQPAMANVGGTLWTDAWRNGSQTVRFDAIDNSGIRHTVFLVDDKVVAIVPHSCDATRPQPCAQGGDNVTISTASLTDGTHKLTAQATDSAGNSTQQSQTIRVDNTPPGSPQGLAVDGGDGWHAANAFGVHWANPPETGAPVAAADWQLCPASGSGACTSDTRSGDGLTSAPDIRVPGVGDWLLRLWLRDAAGNAEPRTAAPPVHLRFDDQAPTATFEPIDPANPTRLAVSVADDISGIAAGQIMLRRQGTDAWRTLPTQLAGGQLVAALPDEHLRRGPYDLQGHVTDAAGNERTTTAFPSGAPAVVTLPVRAITRIVARSRHHRARRTGGRRVVRIAFRHRTILRGRLIDTRGRGIPATPLSVWYRLELPHTPWHRLMGLNTSPHGRYAFRTPRGPSRVYRVRYEGTPTIRPADHFTRIRVAARSTLWVNRRVLRNPRRLRFIGRLLGGHIPPGGKDIHLQVRFHHHWQTFTTAHANRNGRWRRNWPFTPTSVRYTFRAVIPRQRGYPYRTGHSPSVKVLVHGP